MKLSNSLDPDQSRHFVGPDQNVGPDLDPKLFAKIISK